MAANTPSSAEGMSFVSQVKSYQRPFWFAVGMEMVERWAYYGVRLVLALYIVGAVNEGGLGFNHIQKGNIYLWWAIIASFLPMFTGGYADRYGYKKTVAVAIGLKVVGYGLMATQHDYWGFFAGCMLLAAGTGLFKPGVQGLIAHSVSGANASVGWGIFYELVNFGAFLGGILAHPLRENFGWGAVFYFNTALVALNFLPLLMFKEPDTERPAPHASLGAALKEAFGILVTSLRDILQPRLAIFILVFAGFWFSFHQLFDLLPNFIDDWTTAATTPGLFLADGHVVPEQILNINSAQILLLMVPVAFLASKFRSLAAICFGILISLIGILLAGFSQSGLYCIIGVIVFTFGEMLSSPRSKDYMASIAPAGKTGLYLGYSEVPSGIGWALGSTVMGSMYEHHGDKTNFARDYLQNQLGLSAETVQAIPKEKVMEALAAKLHMTVPQATEMLWNLHHPQNVWFFIAGIGALSLVTMLIYDRVVNALDAKRELQTTVPQADGAEISTAQ